MIFAPLRTAVAAFILALVLPLSAGAEALRVFFVGNSYTARHDVPRQLEQIAASAVPPVLIKTQSVTRNGATLDVQLDKARPALQAANWDILVLQDASWMSFSFGTRKQMRSAITQLAELGRAQGARPVLFAHWPPGGWKKRLAPGLTTRWIEWSYGGLARELGGGVAPVGRFWTSAAEAGISGLYAADGHHQSALGAYATALVLFAAIGAGDPATTVWAPDDVSEADARLLRELARDLTP